MLFRSYLEVVVVRAFVVERLDDGDDARLGVDAEAVVLVPGHKRIRDLRVLTSIFRRG
jgi:hypothetical protein